MRKLSHDRKGMIVLQNYMDLPKFVAGETCLTPCYDENQVIDIKVEITDEQDEEDPLSITFPVIKPELEVSCMSVYIVRHVS
jgi:hypothetical protein